jgi:hypothetical protein
MTQTLFSHSKAAQAIAVKLIPKLNSIGVNILSDVFNLLSSNIDQM